MIARLILIFFGMFLKFFTSEALTQFNWIKGTHDDSTISQNILSENVQRYENKYSTLKLESPPQA